MTINKYFVFVPQDAEDDNRMETSVQTEKEAQRQALIKQAQKDGGL